MSDISFEDEIKEIFEVSKLDGDFLDDTIWFDDSCTMFDAIIFAKDKHCIDKQKIIEAIESIVNHGNDRDMRIREYLMKSLKLEEG